MAATRMRMATDARREQLLDAGVTLFARRSWEEVSVDEIAAAAGVSRGLLYHYFAGKRDYYVASIARAVQRMRVLDPPTSLKPTEQLRYGLQRFFASIAEEPDTFLALQRVAPADREVASIAERDRDEFAERVLAGMPGGGGGSPLALATARGWIGAVQAAGLHWLEHPEVAPAALIEVLEESLAAAMLAAARLDPSVELPEPVRAMLGPSIIERARTTHGM